MNDYFSKKKICAGENLGYGQIFFVVRIIMVLVGFIPTRMKAEIRGFVESQFFSNFSALWSFLKLNFN